MIPTLILSPAVVLTEVDKASIVVKQFSDDNILNNLKHAIDWALLNDEDVIYCIASETGKKIVDITNFEDTMLELLGHQVFMY